MLENWGNLCAGKERAGKVYTFLQNCAISLEQAWGPSPIVCVLRMSPKDFQTRWHKLNAAAQEKLCRLADEGSDSLLARIESKSKHLNRMAQQTSHSPANDQGLVDKCRQLMAEMGDELAAIEDM